jgi:hypothetical protein
MTKLRVDAVRAQVVNTARADELGVAANGNKLISKSEQKTLSADLQAAADAVRAQKPGRSISIDEVAAQVGERFDAAVAGVNQAAGSGRPFLSKQEIQNLGDNDPLLGARVQRAVDVLRPAPSTSVKADGADIKRELDAALGSWFFDGILGSEGGEPVTAVLLPAMPWPANGEQLARALGHDVSKPAGKVERFKAADSTLLNEWFDQQQVPAADVARVKALITGLEDPRVLIVGEDGGPGVSANHPTYIVGAAKDGTVVGIRTGVIWT